MQLSKMQQFMVDDGFPTELFITREERAAWWEKNPPKAMKLIDAAKQKNRQEMLDKFKEEETAIRIASRTRKKLKELDARGKRWDSLRNRWIDEDPSPTQDNAVMTKTWQVTSFDSEGKEITKGTFKIEENTPHVEIFSKMGEAFHRCPAGAVKKIIVTNEDGTSLREWEEGGAELPKPEPKEPPVKSPAKAAKGRAKKQAAPPAKTNGKVKPAPIKKGGKKGPGVIDAIIEAIKRKSGASVDEMLDILVAKFPDRDPKGMTATIRIQANKNCSSKEKDDKRGLVYYGK